MAEHMTETLVSQQLYIEVQRFLNQEAGLLDHHKYREWFSLLTDDATYRVFARVNVDAGASEVGYAFVDETHASLRARVEQISNPKLTHAENPASLTRRFISGIEVLHDGADQFVATSNILIYRNRPSLQEEGFYAGDRRDVLRRVDGALRIASRDVRLDQVMIRGAVSTLF
jgi:3-phenylpropionate/cinnamic acid dioxygenase small subunit